jgi:hypothetical protein
MKNYLLAQLSLFFLLLTACAGHSIKYSGAQPNPSRSPTANECVVIKPQGFKWGASFEAQDEIVTSHLVEKGYRIQLANKVLSDREYIMDQVPNGAFGLLIKQTSTTLFARSTFDLILYRKVNGETLVPIWATGTDSSFNGVTRAEAATRSALSHLPNCIDMF